MKTFPLIAGLLCFAGGFSLSAVAESAAVLLKQADGFDEAYASDKALPLYLKVVEMTGPDAALFVKIARQYVYRMGDLRSTAEKIESARVALDYAERAVKLAPKSSDAHLSIAICLGKMTQLQGNREKIEASKRIGECAERAVALNPKNDYAWHLLGRWHQALAGLNGLTRGIAQLVYGQLPAASNEEAVRCFEKAIALRGDRLIHHVELGRTLAQMGRKAEAKAAIERGLAMPNKEKDDPETKERGRETLKKL
jgi:tetratricopeptide (TPR) repeat protein